MADKTRVLLVEDDLTINSMYKTKLELDGFEVLSATDGLTGVQLAKEKGADIILLDVIMPQIDGFTALAELKKDKKTKEIPVIMLTNLGTDEDKAKGAKLGAIDYVVKANFTPAQVTDKIREHLK